MKKLFAVTLLLFITACGSWNKKDEIIKVGQIWERNTDPFMHVKVLAIKGKYIRIEEMEEYDDRTTISEGNLQFFYHLNSFGGE